MRRAARALNLTTMPMHASTSRPASWVPLLRLPALVGRQRSRSRYRSRLAGGPLGRGSPIGLLAGRSIWPPREPSSDPYGLRFYWFRGRPSRGQWCAAQAVRPLPGSARPARRAAHRTSLGCGPPATRALTAVTGPPAAPATLKCEFIPALTGGFLLAPLSLNQA